MRKARKLLSMILLLCLLLSLFPAAALAEDPAAPAGDGVLDVPEEDPAEEEENAPEEPEDAFDAPEDLDEETDEGETTPDRGAQVLVSYRDADGIEQQKMATPLEGGETVLTEGWYAALEDVSFSSRLQVSGGVNLILADGTTLTAPKGIEVSIGHSLTIWGQNADSGALVIDGTESQNAGIGGTRNDSGTITINGGAVTATGGQGGAGIGGGYRGNGTVTVNSGTVTANGGQAGAGIGGGWGGVGTVTVNGGTVTATGGPDAAGIGGGYPESGTVTINGGTVTATGGRQAAGIGGAHLGSGTVEINGGTVTATGGRLAAGIGGGINGKGNVTITGGNINATGGASGIGGGKDNGTTVTLNWTNSTDSIIASKYNGTVTLRKGFTDGTSSFLAGVVSDVSSLSGKTLTPLYCTITYTPGTGSGAAYDEQIGQGVTIELPVCNFTPPEVGYAFKGWCVTVGQQTSEIKQAGATVTVTADTAVEAQWGVAITTWAELQAAIDSAEDDETIILTQNIIAESDDVQLKVRSGKNVTLDLNGFGLDRSMSAIDTDGHVIQVYAGGTLTIKDSSSGKTGMITGGWATNGGGVNNQGTLIVEGGNFKGNKATNGGAILNYGTLTVTGGVFEQNIITGGGGAIWSNGTATITEASIVSNTGAVNGGAIANHGRMSLNACFIQGNSASAAGGAIFTGNNGNADANARLTVTGGIILQNNAPLGGGIYIDSDSAVLNGAAVIGNTASEKGGGVYVNASSSIAEGKLYTYSNTSISQNTAGDGGGIYIAQATVGLSLIPYTGYAELRNTVVSQNKTTAHGGGGITNYGELYLTDSYVEDNSAVGNGGGVWSSYVLKVQGTVTIKDNSSDSGTPNLFLKGTSEVRLTGALSSSAEIHVAAESENLPRRIVYAQDNQIPASASIFHSDMEGYAAVYKNNEVWLTADTYYVNRTWDETEKKVISEPTALGPAKTVTQAAVVSNNVVWLTDGWYLVDVDTYWTNRIVISGTVHLVLMDGVSFTATKGIQLTNGNTLYIYGQNLDSGQLIINGVDDYQAGIGTNDQDDGDNDKAGTLVIHGGTINATGGSDAAGIGGGNEAANGNITIYGGNVTAQGGGDGAGIGTGDEPVQDSGDIKIYGGTVTATGGEYAAGIGGGDDAKGGRIYIYGGNVVATGRRYGAGIGGGEESAANTIQIDGGNVTVEGGKFAAGIGTGYNPSNNSGKLEDIVINGGVIVATSGYCGAAIGSGVDEDITSGDITINGGTIIAHADRAGGAGIGTGENSACGLNITITGGDVTADHKDTSDGEENGGAGIGSGANGDLTGKITITGGVVHASGAGGLSGGLSGTYYGGAGIGCGSPSNVTASAEIKITGGTVTAVGKNGGAAIGAGAEDAWGGGGECEGKITISGGKVTLSLVNSGNAVYCGHGDDGDDNGTLTLADNLKVYYEGSAPVASAQRATTCQNSNSAVLIIEVCKHESITYTVTESTHTGHCPDCNTTFTPEPHDLDHNGKCTVCGYQGAIFTVSFKAGDGGSGTMNDLLVVAGKDYVLPACGFDAPEGKVFAGWSVQIGSAAAIDAQPGDTITVTADTTVTALWTPLPATVTLRFDARGGTVEPTSMEVTLGVAVGVLPVPEREGWEFLGWFTEPAETAFEAGQCTRVTAETTFDADTTIYAHWRLPGDINGDDSVNFKDLTRLQRYLKYGDVDVVTLNLDVNGDGTVNFKDLTRLQRYLKYGDVEIH